MPADHDDRQGRLLAHQLLQQFEAVERELEEYYGDKVNESRMRMANIPAGGELLENPVSWAPGFRLENVYVLPGVPRIMQAMYDTFKHRLAGGRPVRSGGSPPPALGSPSPGRGGLSSSTMRAQIRAHLVSASQRPPV